MATPTSYPVWMQKAGAPNAVCNDALSYVVLGAQGYTYAATVPAVTNTVAGQVVTNSETPINTEQPDANPANQD